MSEYKRRVAEAIEAALPASVMPTSSLDFGAGDGWFWDRFERSARLGDITAVDVQSRARSVRVPQIYDGSILPFEDGSFDLVYAVDVLHHCPSPRDAMSEMARCARRWLLVKDHTQRNAAEFGVLSILDEIGNRKFGVPSRYRYQRRWEWLDHISDLGFELLALHWPVDCNGGVLGRYSKRLNFIGVWQRL